MSGPAPERYVNPLLARVRFVTQELMLKPAVWRLLKVNVHGREHLDTLEAPFVVVGNHSSHFDAPLIVGALPRRLSRLLATGAAADYFFDSWWKSLPMTMFFNSFPIERKSSTEGRGGRGRKGLSGQLLNEGVPLLLFPEGTRSRTGAMAPFKPGAAALCITRGAPCLPVALVGAFAAWPHNQGTPPTNRPEVHVVFGLPLMPQPGEVATAFSERIRRSVQQLHDSTAQAYGLPTLDDYARAVALRQAGVDVPPPAPVKPPRPPIPFTPRPRPARTTAQRKEQAS